MIFNAFSRVFVLVSVCALFAAVSSKPAHLSRQSLERRIIDRAATGTKTLKQYNARAPHSHTYPKRQTSALAAERVAPAADSQDDQDDQDAAAAPAPGSDLNNILVLTGATQPSSTGFSLGVSLPTGLSRRQDDTDSDAGLTANPSDPVSEASSGLKAIVDVINPLIESFTGITGTSLTGADPDTSVDATVSHAEALL